MEIHNHSSHSHDVSTPEEALIMLKYMHHHNEEHTSELKSLAEQFDGEEILSLINAAAEYYNKGNDLLSEAIKKAGE